MRVCSSLIVALLLPVVSPLSLTSTSLKATRSHGAKADSFHSSTGRPWGVLHCSVIKNATASAPPHDDAYILAPPPSRSSFSTKGDGTTWYDDFAPTRLPITPLYERADAVCVTLPREGVGADGRGGIERRMEGIRWLASRGLTLKEEIERVLVLDATDLPMLPLSNDDENAGGADVEALWRSSSKTRILLRRGVNHVAAAAAKGAAEAARVAAEAAERAMEAAESGDAEAASQATEKARIMAEEAARVAQEEMDKIILIRERLENDFNCKVEVLPGGRPIDVMQYLGDTSSYKMVIWRAGCWGEKGVQSIEAGAFQSISAHLAVDANGGRFWQTIVAERCVQGACGARSKIELRSEDDVALEFCDSGTGGDEDDEDCEVAGKVRHVRLDADILLIDDTDDRAIVEKRLGKVPKELDMAEAPWFIA